MDFFEYPYEEALYPVIELETYFKVIKELCMSPRLFPISIKSHRRASRATKAEDLNLQFLDFFDEVLCPVITLERYIKVTKELCMSSRLFLFSMKPYRRASRATLSQMYY